MCMTRPDDRMSLQHVLSELQLLGVELTLTQRERLKAKYGDQWPELEKLLDEASDGS